MQNQPNPAIVLEIYQVVHDWTNSRQIPVELGEAEEAKDVAWNAWDIAVERYLDASGDEREHLAALKQAAEEKAVAASNAVTNWWKRWQRLGGTSDIRSIVDTERELVVHTPFVKVISFMEGD